MKTEFDFSDITVQVEPLDRTVRFSALVANRKETLFETTYESLASAVVEAAMTMQIAIERIVEMASPPTSIQ